MAVTAQKGRFSKDSKEVKEILEYISGDLECKGSETDCFEMYRKRIVLTDAGNLAGVAIVPCRMGLNTIFYSWEGNGVVKGPEGKYNDVCKQLLRNGVDMDNSELIPDGKSLLSHAFKGSSQ